MSSNDERAASPRQLKLEDRAVQQWRQQTADATALFEARWTWLSLRRVNEELARRLYEQRGLFDQAAITGTAEEIERQGSALCRGYAAAVKAMEDAAIGDDAYLLGSDPATGTKVAIGPCKASVSRIAEVCGQDVIWVTPDEVAVLLAAGTEAAKFVTSVKRLFPGAELKDNRYAEAGT